MNKDEIMRVLPHRENMLLLDDAESLEGGAVGHYTVRGDEFFLKGHFPGNPVVPGVILCEMMAQASAVIISDVSAKSTPYFTGIDKAKFRNKVLPGDTLEIKCELTGQKRNFYFIKGKGYVNGKLSVSAEFSFALVERE